MAYENEKNVLPLFIFDKEILDKLENKKDARVQFILEQVNKIYKELKDYDSSILVKLGKPLSIFGELTKEFNIQNVYTNRDYEPYARQRDNAVEKFLADKDIPFYDFKDQVIFEKDEITNNEGSFYKVFTPYSKIWLQKLKDLTFDLLSLDGRKKSFYNTKPLSVPSLKAIGFEESPVKIPALKIDEKLIQNYDKTRNFPAKEGTSRLGIHLRFGTISIRRLVQEAMDLNGTYLNE